MMKAIYNYFTKIRRLFYTGIVHSTVKHCRKNFHIRVLGKVTVRNQNVEIGNGCTIYQNVIFDGRGKIKIGNNCAIGDNTIIYAAKNVTIGDNTLIAANTYILDCNHSTKADALICTQPLAYDAGGVVIGNDVWISANCTVGKGARIEDGAVIGAMSFVNRIIPSNAIAAGAPARVIKYREGFSQQGEEAD